MVSKEVSCTISQFIYNDILDSFEAKGVFSQLSGLSLAASPRILFLCRFPSMVNTVRFSRNLFVVGEDEYNNICAAVSGNHPIDIIIYGIQSRLQDNILQLYHSGSQLRHVLLFHECSFSATCVDLTIGVCTSLRRHRAHIQRINKYKSFEFAQNGRLRTFTKATYFIALSATRNVNSLEVYSPSLEYAETWLCSSKSLTPQIQAAIAAVPGVFRFRVYTHDPPLHTELGATDRCCVTFGIAESEVQIVTDSLAPIYACLSQEIASSTQQDLQRVIPLFWNMRFGDAPTFYRFRTVTFLDIRSCTQEERWQLQSILIDMNIPYYIQKRLLLVIYAEGAELENFRLRTFQEQIKIPFGKEEGSLQCSFTAGINENCWTVDISTTGSDTHEAFQIEDDGSLMMKDGTVDVDFSEELQKVLGAIQIRPAIVHVQDKGQQKVVAFYASPALFPRIPGTFVDHKTHKRIVHYKQPDVHTTERTSNIYVKETKTDHHVGAHNKGLCQGARLSGFFPLPGNSMSRRRFGQLQVFSFEIGKRDVAVDLLDEIVPICFVEAELSMKEVSHLFDILMKQKHLLDHHTIFLECTATKAPLQQHNGDVITTLPEHECIIHCQIEHGQKLQVLQPRFERGKVSRCFSNALELSVYDRANLILFLPGQIDIHDVFGKAPVGRILSIWYNSHSSHKNHATEPFATKQSANITGSNPQRSMNAQRDTSLTGECHDNKQSPARSIPSSSDHNQDAVSPLPTEIDATGSTSHEEESTLKQDFDLWSNCTPTKKNQLCSDVATYLHVKDCDEHQAANQGSQVSPASSLLEFAGTPERLSVSKAYISNTQNDLCSVNEAMQVDEGSALRFANGNIKQDCTACPKGLQQSQACNTETHQTKELPEEKVIVPFSLNECPSGNEASQLSTDSFCEQVYQDLQQQLEDDPKKKAGPRALSTKSKHTVEATTDRKPAPKKSSSDLRRQSAKKPTAKPAPKRGDGLSHHLVKGGINAQHVSSCATNQNSVNEILQNKRRQSYIHQIQQMISRDVSLQNMDFQDEDIQRAVSLYENLNATACYYTAALRIVSKANWNKQVNFENHIGHRAMVAVAKGWTCASHLPNDDFDHYHLALAMSALPEDTHMDLLRTYESIVAIIPPPFHDLLGSRVSFTCLSCHRIVEHNVATFIVTDTPTGLLLHVAFFEAAFPWSEHLLPIGRDDGINASQERQECASNFTWATISCSPCRLVWLHFQRASQPLATDYDKFLNKDTFQSGGQIWQCIALVIHQGPDPLNGEQQPCEHFYVLEHENANSTILKYDNATGLSQLCISQLKAGDRICGILYRHATISSTWLHTRPPKRASTIARGKDSKRAKNKFGQREVNTSKRKHATKRAIDVGDRKDVVGPVPLNVSELQAAYIPEKLCPPPPSDATIPAEQLKAIEISLSQSSQADHLSSPASPFDQPMQSCESKPPYAVLSMFDGCGSSLDILIEKFGYRPKVCVLCERDETLRYLVAEKHGISVNVQWIHSLKGGIFLYANDVDILFDDGARILREFVTLSDSCHVFVIGGSPCTDLTYAGQEHGRLGICGPDSVFFFTMHLALYLLGTVLPKTHIRFLIENAGSMHYDHFTFIRACLGLSHITRDKMTWCTSKISPAKRLRLFLQNNILHDTVDSQALCQEDLQWPADWKPLSIHDKGKFRDVFIKPFMRPLEVLSDIALRYSWTSYHPAALLWRTSYWHTHERFAVIANMFTDSSVPAFQWSDFIPAIYYPAWRRFLSCFYNKTSSNPEKDAVLRDVLPLFHNSSIRVPFRFLTDSEVLQVSGLSRNFATISRLKHVLHSQTIRSFVGNSFHPKLISLAIGTPDHVRAWIQGKTECFFGVASPDDVRQGYVSFRQTIENNLKMSGRSTQTTIVPEPYRHINYRSLVMSPVARPPIAQPIVTQKLPHYLTKEAIDNSNNDRREQRFDILGKEPLIKFLTDLHLLDYAEQAAVPQWIFFNEEIVQALCTLSVNSDALNTYRQELLHHCTYHRITLFLRQLLITIKTADTGFIVCWLAHQPIHMRYLGPSRATHLYLLCLHDTLEILLFKYGGEPVRICQPSQSSSWYRSMFGFQTNPQGVGTEHLCAFAIQQERICTITEKPWAHSFVEPGCALWRLSHLLLAAENRVCKEPFANVCHLALGSFPVILIGGLLQDWCLSICPESARAAHPRLQENIWQTDKLPNFCLLLIHQLEAPDTSNCERLISLTPTPHTPHPVLPATSATEQAAIHIPTEACIDDCQLMTLKSVWYVCTQGEISAKIFHRAKALIHPE